MLKQINDYLELIIVFVLKKFVQNSFLHKSKKSVQYRTVEKGIIQDVYGSLILNSFISLKNKII